VFLKVFLATDELETVVGELELDRYTMLCRKFVAVTVDVVDILFVDFPRLPATRIQSAWPEHTIDL
jgi:hypothetical protein